MGSEREDRRIDSGTEPVTADSPHTINARAAGASVIQVDLGMTKAAMAVLWISSLISGMALAGLIATCFFIYKNIGYTAVLQYDLFDLRAKVGEAHENTPVIEDEP